MTTWPTRRKSGTPDTINIAVDELSVELSGTPAYWVLPIIGVFEPITLSTDDLCSAPPPPTEYWTFADLLGVLNASTRDFELDKARRMAMAAQWPTYCEYYGPDVSSGPIIGTVDTLQDETFGHVSFSPPRMHIIGGDDESWRISAIDQEADAHVAYMVCVVAPTDHVAPTLSVIHPDGGNYANVVTSGFPAYAGDDGMVIFNTKDLQEAVAPETLRYRLNVPADGLWLWLLKGMHMVAPATPVPWPQAPAEPLFQFSQECVDALCSMASDFPAVSAGVGEALDDLNLLLAGTTPTLTRSVVSGGSLSAGPNETSIPAGGHSAVIYTTAGADHARIGSTPEVVWQTGWVAMGDDNGWLPSVPIKHPEQLVGPFPDGITRLAVELAPDVSGHLDFVILS